MFSTKTVPETFEDIKLVTESCGPALDPLEFEVEYYSITLGEQLTNVAGETFSLASTNALYDAEDEEPTIRLQSRSDRASIAVYHFSEVAPGWTVSSISIDNKSRFYGADDHGFFLGYRHDTGEEYKWYGPFDADDGWLLPLTPRQTYRPTSPSLAVVTTRGDILELRSFTVSVESYLAAYRSWQISLAEYEQRMYDLERERYEAELERLRLYEEWQRLEYEYYLLRERERALERDHYRDRHYRDGHRDYDRDRHHERGRDREHDDGDRHWEDQDGSRGRRMVVTEEGRVVPESHNLAPPSR
jgi:hypothetical protein